MKQIVSERLKSIDQTYEQVKAAVNSKMDPKGYLIIDEQYHTKSFGSRFVTWSNKIDAIRLVWDGKDDWFYLQATHTQPFDWTANWKNLIYIPYLREHDLEYASSLPGKIVASLDRGG